MNRRDPRIRQTLDRLTSTLESAQNTTQTSLFTFTQAYIDPCLSWARNCLEASCSCIVARDRQRARRTRRNSGRGPEFVFDFYNDEETADESTGLLSGWGTDELERLIAGAGAGGVNEQPRRGVRMSYGTKRRAEPDPTIVPGASSRRFGFLEWLPFVGSAKQYDPDSADLIENPGQRTDIENEQPARKGQGHGRKRSGTASTQSTQASLSSRGDLFPSDDEDAVLVDDDFAFVLERRITSDASSQSQGQKEESQSRLKVRSNRASHGSRVSATRLDKSRLSGSRTLSSESTNSAGVSATQMSMSEHVSPLYDLEASLGSLRRETLSDTGGDAEDEKEKDDTEDDSPLLMKSKEHASRRASRLRREEKSPTPSSSKRRSRVEALRNVNTADYFSLSPSPARSPVDPTSPGEVGKETKEGKESKEP